MSIRDSYQKMSIEEFKEELESDIRGFVSNMLYLGRDDFSFPEWYESFGAWLEVGTDEEKMMYHRTDFCTDKECKFC